MNNLDLITYIIGLVVVVVLLGNIVFSVVSDDQHIKDNIEDVRTVSACPRFDLYDQSKTA